MEASQYTALGAGLECLVQNMQSPDLKLCEQVLKGHVGSTVPCACSGFEHEVCEGAVKGGDVRQFRSLEEWIQWLSWASVVLGENDYLKAAVHALRLAREFAATDYGTARRRDLGQLWTDTIRGLLGEIVFVNWLKDKFKVEAEPDFRRGRLEEFLPSDIGSATGRKPNLKVSIKTTKLDGIWLDIPGAQIQHSDIFVFVRIGVTREHFIAFLKKISVIREKILEKALEKKIISGKELEEVWERILKFSIIPAYIAGFFFDKRQYADELKRRQTVVLEVGEGIKGERRRRLVINKFLGFWDPHNSKYKELVLKRYQELNPSARIGSMLDIESEGIRSFSEELHLIASSGF